MIEILLTMIAFMLAAKKPVRRRRANFGNYMRGRVEQQLNLGTLAGRTAISVIFDNVVTETTRISSVVITYALSHVTPIADNGPFVVGVAHSDYTTAEIEATLESTQSWNKADLVQKEISGRLIRTIGTFSSVSGASTDKSVLNDGKPIKTKLNWVLQTGQSLQLWCYNSGSVATATTDPEVSIIGHANLWAK